MVIISELSKKPTKRSKARMMNTETMLLEQIVKRLDDFDARLKAVEELAHKQVVVYPFPSSVPGPVRRDDLTPIC